MRLGRNPAWTVAQVGRVADARKTFERHQEYAGHFASAAQGADRRGRISRADAVFSGCGRRCGGGADRKQRLGAEAAARAPNRTTGAFATSYKSRVLPTFLTVVDDPTMKDFRRKKLDRIVMKVDSEGVKAQAVDVITNGMLTNYLLGRQPIRDFPVSNGHGRAAPAAPPVPALGVLLVKSSEAQTPEALRKRVIANGHGPGAAIRRIASRRWGRGMRRVCCIACMPKTGMKNWCAGRCSANWMCARCAAI